MCTYIWNDDKFPFAPDDVQLVWFHIFTNPLSSPIGVFRATLSGLAEDKNRNGQWPIERYMLAVNQAITDGFIQWDAKALLVAFPKYFSPQHVVNHPVSPNQVKKWGKIFAELPESPLKEQCYHGLKGVVDGQSDAMRDAFDYAFGMAYVMPSAIPEPYPNPYPNPHPNTKTRERDAHTADRKTGFPDGFKFSDRHETIAKGLGLNIQREFAKFESKAKAKGFRYIDWDAAFRNWLINEKDYKDERSAR